jgi:hypothetical protein
MDNSKARSVREIFFTVEQKVKIMASQSVTALALAIKNELRTAEE